MRRGGCALPVGTTDSAAAARSAPTPPLQAQEHLDGSIGMVLYEYNNGKIGPAGMEVRARRAGQTACRRQQYGQLPASRGTAGVRQSCPLFCLGSPVHQFTRTRHCTTHPPTPRAR